MKSCELILPLLLTLLSTCKKDNEDDCSTPCPCTGDACIAEMKEWFYFLPGTYWIYQEQTSGALDTVHVFDSSEGTAPNGQQWFRVETQSSVLEEWIPGDWVKYNYYYNFSEFYSQECRYAQCTCHILERVKSRPLDFVASTNLLLFPFIEGESIFVSGGGSSTFLGYLDSISTQVGVFNNVSEVYHETDVTEHNKDVIYRLSKNHGVIQKILPEDEKTWELIEYNIIQ